MEFSFGETISVESDGARLVAREIARPAGPIQRIIGAVAGLAFLAVAAGFAVMPLSGTGPATPYLRAALCAGLGLAGIGILWSALARRTTCRFIEADPERREIRFGRVRSDRPAEILGTIPFSDLERLHAGTNTDTAEAGGVTILYARGRGAPRKGDLIAGNRFEIDMLCREISGMIGRRPL